MRTEEKYNGWTNYETWNVILWINNEQGTQDFWHQVANGSETIGSLARALEEHYREDTPTVTGCYADLLNAALSQVNWYEIADSLISNALEIANQEIGA